VHAAGLIPADASTLARLTRIRATLSVAQLPASVDISAKMPPVGDQGSESSCASWATAYELRGYEARQDLWSFIDPKAADASHNFSPAFLYNQVNGGRDQGSSYVDNFNLMQAKGVALLSEMPYQAGNYTATPSPPALRDALNYKIRSWGSIDLSDPSYITTIKGQLAAGNPVAIGIKLYGEFYALRTDQTTQRTATGSILSYHAVTLVGYDDRTAAFKLINSWGTIWGAAGYGYISYGVFPQLINEAYTAIDNNSPAPTPSPTPTPTPRNPFTFTNLSPSTVAATAVGYQPTLTASGSGFSNVTQVRFTQSGATNGGPWIWNKGDSNWNGKVTVNSNTSMSLRPVVTQAGDAVGQSTWTVRLTDTTNASQSRTFTLNYTRRSR
jgi:hypothetical protein